MDGATARHCFSAVRRIGCLGLALAGPLTAQTLFTEVEPAGLQVFTSPYPRDMTFVDYDNDGLQDVFLVGNGYQPPQSPRQIGLFRNAGDGRFTDQTALLPVEVDGVIGGGGAVFGDYDNDGDEDLFLPVQPHNVLLRNDRGRFTIADPGPGLRDSISTDNAIWLDYDRDGHLDLYVGNLGESEDYPRGYNRLFRNLGDGTFADQTDEAGLAIEVEPVFGGSLGGMAAGDFNDDGWPDLYLGVLSPPGGLGAPNRLFLSDTQGGFRDATTSEIGDRGEAFAVAVGDTDNDGDLDIFQAAAGYGESRSPLLLNLGGGDFLDVTDGSGLAVLGVTASSASFADIDNDGDLDLIVGSSKKAERYKSFFFLNDGTGSFVDQSAASGVDGRGYIAVGDYDGDGFVDLLIPSQLGRNVALYRNNGNANHWLRVELVGVESNRSGIGARVLATSGDLAQMREILGGLGRCQNERAAHFGLGSRTQVDRLVIRWPSGQEDVLYDVPADQKIRVFEGREGYHPVKPTVWVSAPPEAVVGGARSRIAAAVKPALFEADARVARLTADLRQLGGPADLPLVPGEGGVFRLDTTLQVDVPRGSYTVWVDIEQQTSLGDYWVRLSQQVRVVSGEDLSVFGRAGEGGWTWHAEDLTRVTDDPGSDRVAAWSPDGTRLAFNSDRDGNGEIYVCNADGSGPANLTDDPHYDGWPSWSPDGSKIVFLSDRDDNAEIYVMDADGGHPVNVTNHDSVDAYPAWSPDGTKIAFHTDRDGNSEIYVMDADGGNPTNLTNHDAYDVVPSWSPDGGRIAFLTPRGGGDLEVFVLDLVTGDVANVTDRFAIPSSPWSPDGRQIAFESARTGDLEIYAMEVGGGDPIRLSHHPGTDMNAAWSPEGSRICFASDRTGDLDLFILTLGEASRVEIDPHERGSVYTGSEALAVHAGAEWWLSCQPAEPFEWAGHRALHFAFHPGDLGASAGDELSAWIGGQEVDLLADGRIDLAVAEWQVVEIPLTRFALTGPFDAIDFSGDVTGTFHIDDVRLVAIRPNTGETAVEEETGEGLPTHPLLAQNYPNPFNAGTVIDFSLSKPGKIRLTVHNLAGQQVVTLVRGRLAAGAHTIRWDGRDGHGRILASGVYLYRLRTGGQAVLTRKLALIR